MKSTSVPTTTWVRSHLRSLGKFGQVAPRKLLTTVNLHECPTLATLSARFPDWKPPAASLRYPSVTRIAFGKVVRGQIIYEGEPSEGAAVTLIAHDDEQTFKVSPEFKAVLLESIAQCDRGETISVDELLREMRSRE